MSLTLRILLLMASLCMFFFIARKLKKSEIDIQDALFWIISSVLFIIISIFPNIVIKGSDLLGFVSPVNFIFLIIIGLLLVKVFLLTLKVSKLEYKLLSLVEEIAIRKMREK